MKLRVALSAPVDCGLKVTVNGTLLPAAMVTGSDSPLTEKAALLELTAVTVTDAPLAVKLPDPVPLLPTTTFPTPRLLGETLSWPTAAVPVPESEMLRVELDALDVTVTAPVTPPAEDGENLTSKLALCPDVRVTGRLIPLTENTLGLALTCEIVRLDPPVFVTVSERVWLFPTVILSKPRLAGLADNAPWVMPVPDNPIVSVGFEPLEVIVTNPLAEPLLVGAKETVKEVL